MGGTGSGNWYPRGNRKTTVEDSCALSVTNFRGRLFHGASGEFTWTYQGHEEATIGYFVRWSETVPTITLEYYWREREDIKVPIRLQSTPTQFAGKRWWFTCPLIVEGRECNRRVGKLYLPPGEKYFGCRHCHELTYRSCQEAHQLQRALAQAGMYYDPALVREMFRSGD